MILEPGFQQIFKLGVTRFIQQLVDFMGLFPQLAAIFVGDLFDAYTRYADLRDWTVQCQLATTRNGYHVTRVANRKPFIPLGAEGSSTAKQIYPIAPVAHQDRWLIYASASAIDHATPISEKPRSYTVLYEMRPDGFVSFRAGDQEGSLVTRDFTLLHDTVSVS